MYYSDTSTKSSVRCQSILFLLVGLFLLGVGADDGLDALYMFFDLSGGLLMFGTGVFGLLATYSQRFISWFIAFLYIYTTLLMIIYAGSLLAVLFLALFFPTCNNHSSSDCSNQQGIQVVVMIIYMLVDFGLFCLVTLATYTIRDARKLQSL